MQSFHPCLASALLAGSLCAQQWAQLPDNHFLGESATQAHASGIANYWGGATATGRRFQVLYDASHFTGIHGVAGPISIDAITFRGEDTEHNVGGQTFTNVVVNVYRTSLSSVAALNTTFATNVGAGVATLLSSVTLPVLTAGPSIGRAPNNDILTINLPPSVPLYDPTALGAPQVNLLVDISYASAAVAPDLQGSTMVAIQDTTGVIGFVRGRALYAATAAALVGTASSLPPTMRVQFSGAPGGFPVLTPARNERYGAACGGSPSTFYQLFAHDQYMDLKDPGQIDGLSGLSMIPSLGGYLVVGGAGPINLANITAASLVTSGDDDTMVVNMPPSTSFAYPGGVTTVIRASSNGYVIVDPASAEGTAVPGNFAGDYSPTVLELLGTPVTNLARFAPCWHDWSPNKNASPLPFADPLSGLHVFMDMITTEVLVTWYRVGRFNSVAQVFQEEHTMQCSLNWTTNVVEFRYGNMGELWGDTFTGLTSCIVGFSRGAILGVTPSVDPQSRDLSIERPFNTKLEGATGNIGQTVVASTLPGGAVYLGRSFGNQTLRWNASNIPAGTILGMQLLDIAASRPGLQLLGITAPGCMLSTTTGALLWESFFLPGSAVTGTVPFFVPAGYQPTLQGLNLYAQFVVLDGLFNGGDLITSSSNALCHTIGNN